MVWIAQIFEGCETKKSILMNSSLLKTRQFWKILFFCLLLITMAVDAFSQDLIAHYPFDGNANNSHSDDYHGTISGAIPTSDYLGNANAAYHFNGNSTITFGDLPIEDGSFTITFWMKSYVQPGQSFRILAKRPSCNVGQLFDIGYTYNSSTGKPRLSFEARDDNAGNYASVSSDFEINDQWVHVAWVKDNDHGESRLYINGQLLSSNPWTNPNGTVNMGNNASLGIGTSPCIGSNGISRFIGDLDELRVYSAALSDSEVQSLSPFALEIHSPFDGQENVASSTNIVLDFTRNTKSSSVNNTNIVVTGSTSGILNTTIGGAGTDRITINIIGDLPYNEEITVSTSNIESINDELLPSLSFSFNTISVEETLILDMPMDGDATNLSSSAISAVNNGASTEKNRIRSANSALYFDGSSDYLEIANTDLLDFGYSNDFSISFWAKTTANGSNQVVLQKSANNQHYLVQFIPSGSLQLQLMDDSSVDEVTTPTEYTDGMWHHFALVADRDDMLSIYVDGALSTEAPVSNGGNISNTGNLIIGANANNHANFNGTLDDFKIYNRKLTNSEILDLAPVYYYPIPNAGYDAAPIDTDIVIEFGASMDASTINSTNISVQASQSGSVSFSILDADSRIITLDPTNDLVYDEIVTVSFSNLMTETGRAVSDAVYEFETTGINKGMLLHYSMNGDAMNEADDRFHGAVSGATLTEGWDGTLNGAYHFDGEAYITSGNLPITDQSFSVALWMKRQPDEQRMEIIGKRNACSTVDFMQVSSSYNSTSGLYLSLIHI